MAKIVLHKLDSFINHLTLVMILGGGMIIHTLTALTIKSYYGDLWGFVSFLLPGAAESYLIFIQLGDNMYNYSILVAVFAAITLAMALTLLLKSVIRSKVETILNRRASQS